MSDKREPFLRVRASGLSGSGYAVATRPDENGKPLIVPSVTTVIGVLEKPGIVDWAVSNTAAYAVANIDALLNRDETQGFGFLRWYTRRMKPEDFDNPEIDIRDYSNGVLNDLASLGSAVHNWIEDHLNGDFEPDLVRDEQVEMVEEFLAWKQDQDIEVIGTEVTVVGATEDGLPYAGTLDALVRHEGKVKLWDFKTSRNTHSDHVSQLSALGAAQSMIVEVHPETEGAHEYKGKWFVEEPLPGIQEYGLLHLRPSDFDTKGNPMEAFCKYKPVDQRLIEAAWKRFRGALIARHADHELKVLGKQGVVVQ